MCCIYATLLYSHNMTRWSHRQAEVRRALDEAASAGLRIKDTPGAHGHSWGYSTARMPIARCSRAGTTWIPRLGVRATRPTRSADSSGGTSTRSDSGHLPLAAGEGTHQMPTFEFTLRLDQEVSEAQADALYGVFHDGSIMTGPGGTEIEFTRDADGWVKAIVSAVHDVESIPGLRVTGAGHEDLVSLLDIAHRARRSREAARLWAAASAAPAASHHQRGRALPVSGSGHGRTLPGGSASI